MLRALTIWLTTVLTCFGQSLPSKVAPSPLPPPPPGYQWQELPEIRSHCLRPDGWHFTQGKTLKGGWSAYFITREKLEGQGRQLTGMTIVPRQNIFGRYGLQPSRYAKQLAAEAGKEFGLIGSFHVPPDKIKTHGYELEGFAYRYPAPGGASRVVLTVCFCFDPSDLLYLTTFEAAESEMNEASRIADVLQKILRLETDL